MTTSEETKVAVMQKEISYISKQVDTIVSKLDSASLKHEEAVNSLKLDTDRRLDLIHTRIDEKADKTEVEKINATISRLAWFVVLAVVGAIISTVLTK